MDFSVNRKYRLRNKYIILTTLSILLICNIALLIITSWYKYDLAISEYFNKAMKYSFVRGWTGYAIIDGYVVIVTFIVALAFIIIESIYAWARKTRAHSMKLWNPKSLKVIYILGSIAYAIGLALGLAITAFNDQGFGYGFSMWFIIGLEYLIPIYVVSLIINYTMYAGLICYVHFVLAKRPDFLERAYWKKALIVYIFTIFLYIPMAVIKSQMGRPYLWDINWHDYLGIIKEHYPHAYDHYIHQDTFWYGWKNTAGGVNDLSFPEGFREWPWWKVGHGMITHPAGWEHIPAGELAFPSGHVDECSVIIASLVTIFSSPRTKKEHNIQLVMFILGVLFLTNMFFTLIISLNHWTSDMAFSLTWAPFGYILAYELVLWFFEPQHINWVPKKIVDKIINY